MTNAPDTSPVLRMRGVSKRFGTLVANDAISLDLHAGEVLALLGENGAGKSTLMSILFGHYAADAGAIEVFGRALPSGQPGAALAAGIGMVHQHFMLADNLTVLDNIVLGTEPLWRPWSARQAARTRLLAVAKRFGLPVAPDARVAALSVGERQRVEILKALYRGSRILILDEPTAVLTPAESEALFATLAQLVQGGLSVIFISHKLGEVLRVSNRIAVLRAGRLVVQTPNDGITQAQLAQWMVGHAVEPVTRQPARQAGDVVCALDQVHTPGRGHDCLRGVSLSLRSGEITAIAGVSGNGQVALAELLSGVRHATQGQVCLGHKPLQTEPSWLVSHGVARVPEDRQAVGIIGDLSVWENAVSERLPSHDFSHWAPLGLRWIRRDAARAHAQSIISTYDVRGAGLDVAARNLSGGNMQKLILGRALTTPDHRTQRGGAPRLIVAHQPTWGLDIGAVAFVHQRLLAARDGGAAVLLISDDLDEVLALGDQVAVMRNGTLSATRAASDWTRQALGLEMAGA
jgi:ABC-type uncharacterized transport system ATPase subunit